ncbi:MAG: 16S rRNA (cytidine(1402)-2'-O)-methyltransferase [Holosporaceae bacterium]|nr:16S rRNA (cytidine(1402)-2'-O)-methyltransferase [Holosporaceae bacterium]
METFFSPQLLEKISQKMHDQQHKPGLYVVATPIGNIFDISLRAIHILKKSQYIFAEDTRQSRKLLDFYHIETPTISCHEHNECGSSVVSKIKNDEIYALISDAGTPLISDPGYKIVNWCLSREINVFPVPGASSIMAGLSAAGLPTDTFTFCGFLPAKSAARRSNLTYLKTAKSTLVFLESPQRLLNTLKDMLEIFEDRRCCICREITKFFEEFKRENLSKLAEYFSENNPVGEFVIIVAGNEGNYVDESAIFSELARLLEKESLKSSVEKIAQKHKFSKKRLYEKALEIKGEKP